MAGRRACLAAMLLLGLCATAMAGRTLLQEGSHRSGEDAESTMKMNDASANIIKMQQRLSGLGARGGRVLLQESSHRTADSTFKMNDASASIIKMQQRLSGLAARGGRVLLQESSHRTADSTFKMNDASASIIKMQQRLSGLAARSGRVLLQSGRSTSDRMTQNTIKINAAADLVHQATTRMMAKVKSRIGASELKATKAASQKQQ